MKLLQISQNVLGFFRMYSRFLQIHILKFHKGEENQQISFWLGKTKNYKGLGIVENSKTNYPRGDNNQGPNKGGMNEDFKPGAFTVIGLVVHAAILTMLITWTQSHWDWLRGKVVLKVGYFSHWYVASC